MKSRVDAHFRKLYIALPAEVRKNARTDYKAWVANPYDNSLRFKEVVPKHKIWSVRAGISYRACGVKISDDLIIWFWIGSHATYDALLAAWQKANASKVPQVGK